MTTCGYICPSCEGRTVMDDGSPCPWCQPLHNAPEPAKDITDEEWISSVHSGSCCSDPHGDDKSEEPIGQDND